MVPNSQMCKGPFRSSEKKEPKENQKPEFKPNPSPQSNSANSQGKINVSEVLGFEWRIVKRLH